MNSDKKILRSLVIIVLAISLSACGGGTPAEPTIDPNVIKTEAVETAFAQMTLEAIMNPSATPLPTETAIPTNTMVPTMTNTSAPLPGVSTSVVTAALPGVAATLPASGSVSGTVNDKAQWVSQIPEDGTKYYLVTTEVVSHIFNIIWTVQNTGTTTWNDSYKLRYYSGDKFFRGETEFDFPEDISVAPGKQADLPIVASYPDSEGTYESVWVLTNPEGVNFQVLTIKIVVINGRNPEE
jgi:hypothetical protein